MHGGTTERNRVLLTRENEKNLFFLKKTFALFVRPAKLTRENKKGFRLYELHRKYRLYLALAKLALMVRVCVSMFVLVNRKDN